MGLMKINPSISFLSIAVEDMEVSKDFYSNILGWTPEKESSQFISYKMNGFYFCIYPVSEMKKDLNPEKVEKNASRTLLSINLPSPEELNVFFEYLREKKVKILKSPEIPPWGGLRGYFCDPDEVSWEVVYNPRTKLDSQGNIIFNSPSKE